MCNTGSTHKSRKGINLRTFTIGHIYICPITAQALQNRDCAEQWKIEGASNSGLYRPVTEMGNIDIAAEHHINRADIVSVQGSNRRLELIAGYYIFGLQRSRFVRPRAK